MNNEEYLKTGNTPEERANAFANTRTEGLTAFQKRHPEVVGRPIPLSSWYIKENNPTIAEASKSSNQNK